MVRLCEEECGKMPENQGKIRNWMITCNNWTQQTHDNLINLKNCKYLFQHEVGEEGTPHIQGVLMFKNPRTWSQLRKTIGEYWFKPAKNIFACKKYCSKVKTRVDGEYFTNIPEYLQKKIKDPLKDRELHDFQKQVLEIIDGEPDDRTIHWFWEAEGCRGKTSLAKHICIHNKDAILIGGKASDMKCGIAKMIESGNPPRIVLMNITRTIEDYISYEGIEAVKDGIFFSGKYESGMCLFDNPHIVIFANFEPNYEAMSQERWNVVEI